MKYSTYPWDLVKALESVSPASCKTPVTFIDSIRHKQLTKKKQKKRKNEIQLSRNGIALPWAMYTEPTAKTGRLGTHS